MTVGNGGFSLRSARLLAATAADSFSLLDGYNEDELICRMRRPILEAQGLCIAPPSVAAAFSYEREDPVMPSFGFHGLFNMWRHLADDALVHLVGGCDPRVFRSREFLELTAQYHAMRKFEMVAFLFQRIQETATPVEIASLAAATWGNSPQTATLLAHCSSLVAKLC